MKERQEYEAICAQAARGDFGAFVQMINHLRFTNRPDDPRPLIESLEEQDDDDLLGLAPPLPEPTDEELREMADDERYHQMIEDENDPLP